MLVIAIVHAGYFIAAVAAQRYPEILIGLGLPVVALFVLIAFWPIRAIDGQYFGGGPLIARVGLYPDESMLLDVPIRWGFWPGVSMGHLLVTTQRIVVVPIRFHRRQVSQLRVSSLLRVDRLEPRDIWGWLSNEGTNLDLTANSNTLRVRPAPGFRWMGGYSVEELEEDICAALHHTGWAPAV